MDITLDITSLTQFIKKALKHYDTQCLNYIYLTQLNNDKVKFNESLDEITFMFDEDHKKVHFFELLGYFDNQTNIWIWGWLLPTLPNEHLRLVTELLNYGLKLETLSNSFEHFYIKSLLVNSRSMIQNQIELDINLAICSYLLKDKIKFIYPRIMYTDDTKSTYITVYYLVK